ncbi:oxygen-evolving enhancer protein 3, chloroplastic [Scenedesmus sp. NREL 46B-D3]|nr:oxygen-evolving enhancer protein 3, chloroplastic [Scenedesmus sp. NREL 46B-D3]
MRTSVAARSATRAARPSRTAVVVRAEARREVLAGFVAAGAALLSAGQAQALSPVDLFDDRKARNTGFDLIYEARDTDLDQATRDGFTQARADIEATKRRIKESEARIDSSVASSIEKAYWTEAREELRRQMGTLRFDLNTLATAKTGKEEKKAALALRKQFIRSVEDLDLAMRKKDKDSALAKLATAKANLDSVIANVL